MKDAASPWTVLNSRIVYENRWIQVQEDKVITPSGSEGVYGFMKSNNSVMVVALNDKNEVYLVRTFRYPDQSWNWELPGGGGDREHAIEASKRELEQETGIRAKTWEQLGETLVCNGLMTEKMVTCLAHNLSFDGQKEVANEQINNAGFFSLDEIYTMIERGDINDGQSMTGLFLLQHWQRRNSGAKK